MKCVECGGATEVVDSRKFDTVVWRRRRCLKCNHRVHTHETVIEKKEREPRLQEQPKKPEANVMPLPVRNPRKQIEDLREYLEYRKSSDEDSDGRC